MRACPVMRGRDCVCGEPFVGEFSYRRVARGKIIGNKVSTLIFGSFRTGSPAQDEGADLTVVESIQFMQATGGNETRDRLLILKIRASLTITILRLLRACRRVEPQCETAHQAERSRNKFSKETVIDGFSVNALPPDDYGVYYNYIHAMVRARERVWARVLSWGWGVLVEFENASWFHDKAKERPRGVETRFQVVRLFSRSSPSWGRYLYWRACDGVYRRSLGRTRFSRSLRQR